MSRAETDASAASGTGVAPERIAIAGGYYWHRYTPLNDTRPARYGLRDPQGRPCDTSGRSEASAREIAQALSSSAAGGGAVPVAWRVKFGETAREWSYMEMDPRGQVYLCEPLYAAAPPQPAPGATTAPASDLGEVADLSPIHRLTDRLHEQAALLREIDRHARGRETNEPIAKSLDAAGAVIDALVGRVEAARSRRGVDSKLIAAATTLRSTAKPTADVAGPAIGRLVDDLLIKQAAFIKAGDHQDGKLWDDRARAKTALLDAVATLRRPAGTVVSPELRALSERATEGRWHGGHRCDGAITVGALGERVSIGSDLPAADAMFAAETVNLVRDLIAGTVVADTGGGVVEPNVWLLRGTGQDGRGPVSYLDPDGWTDDFDEATGWPTRLEADAMVHECAAEGITVEVVHRTRAATVEQGGRE